MHPSTFIFCWFQYFTISECVMTTLIYVHCIKSVLWKEQSINEDQQLIEKNFLAKV